jgi:hypothetical protein
VMAGGVAGATAAAVTTPLDVAKVRRVILTLSPGTVYEHHWMNLAFAIVSIGDISIPGLSVKITRRTFALSRAVFRL